MDDWTLIALEEYKTLRAESLEAIRNQHSVMRIAALAFSLLLGSAFALVKQYPFLAFVELVFLSPAVILFMALNWVHELNRMAKAGNYIVALEKEINKKIKNAPLLWEQWLRSGTKLKFMGGSYITTLIGVCFLWFVCMTAAYYICKWNAKATVEFEDTLVGLQLPDSLKDKISYDDVMQQLMFNGVMKKEERDELLKLSREPSYQEAVKKLFQKSSSSTPVFNVFGRFSIFSFFCLSVFIVYAIYSFTVYSFRSTVERIPARSALLKKVLSQRKRKLN